MSGFRWLLHAELTKLRTVRGWVVGLAAGILAMTALGVLPGMKGSCNRDGWHCALPVGPGGEEVVDRFVYARQPFTGDGSLTVRVASLTGAPPPGPGAGKPILAPWAKAGVMIKDGIKPGSAYAAVLLTASHGVRLQHNYTQDRAGSPGSGPRWLRLTRSGDTITGAESADGAAWTTVGSVRLPGLPATAQAGLFVTSPDYSEQVAAAGVMSTPTSATGVFDHVTAQGAWAATQAWNTGPANVQQNGDTFTLTGDGDIGPAVAGAAGLGVTISQTLLGTFLALLFVVVIGALAVTGEYRRGLIRTTFAAIPARGRVLAAKAVVLAAVTGTAGLIAAAVVVTVGRRVLQANGVYVHAASTLTQVRVVAGTGALLAVAAVLALALGTLMRRGTPAVATAVVLIVLPYLLAMTVLPAGPARWLLRVTPAAAFALQQSAGQYDQVEGLYIPPNGYFPLPPWGGLAVLVAWTAGAVAAAAWLLRRRDA